MSDWKWLEALNEVWNHPAINTHNNFNRDKTLKLIKTIREMKKVLEFYSCEDAVFYGITYQDHATHRGTLDCGKKARIVLEKLSRVEI